MLFDMRGRGRRNTIKVIYIFLAILMGGGLILFGIGGATNGGLLDAVTNSGGSSGSGSDRYEKQVKASETTLRTNPKDRRAYENLIAARVQLAGFDDHYDDQTDTYDAEGMAILKQAAADWDKYQALKPKVDEAYGLTANRIATAFIYLQQPEKYLEAQQVVAEARNATGPYQQLATAAYQLGKIRLGDLAAAKAVELASDDQKATVKSDMESAKQAAPTDTPATPVPTPSASATGTAEATASPTKAPKKSSDSKPAKKDSKKKSK